MRRTFAAAACVRRLDEMILATSAASSAFARASSGADTSRSAKTFPVLTLKSRLLFIARSLEVLRCVNLARTNEPLPHDVDLMLRRLDSLPGFLLERMQDVDSALEPDGVDGAVGIALIVVHDLQHSTTTQALQRLRVGVLSAGLSEKERVPHHSPHLFRETLQVLLRPSDPQQWLGPSVHRASMPHLA